VQEYSVLRALHSIMIDPTAIDRVKKEDFLFY